MPGHLFDELKAPAGRVVNAANVSRAVAGAGHAIKRAEAEVNAARKALDKGADPGAKAQLARAEDALLGAKADRGYAVRSVAERVKNGDTILTTPLPLTVADRVAAERRRDAAETYAAGVNNRQGPSRVELELRETRRALEVMHARLAED